MKLLCVNERFARASNPGLERCLARRPQARQRRETSRHRQGLYARRFRIIGWWWEHKFRHLRFAQAMRAAFQTPSLYSIPHEQQTYWLPRRHFFAAWAFAVDTDPAILRRGELESFMELAWQMFDVSVAGSVDYREVLCVWSAVRLEWHTSAQGFLQQCFRNYDGDVRGGVSLSDLRSLLVCLCTNEGEARKVLALADFSLLQPAADEAGDSPAGAVKYGPDEPFLLGIERHLGEVEAARGDRRRLRALARKQALATRTRQGSSSRGREVDGERVSVDPITGEPVSATAGSWVTLRAMNRMLNGSQDLLQHLEELLRRRLPPTVAAKRIRRQLERRCALAAEQIARVHGELRLRDALLMWSHQSLRRWFNEWKVEIGRDIILRRKVALLARTRVVRAWRNWAYSAARQRAKLHLARERRRRKRKREAFRAWRVWLLTALRMSALQHLRAERSYEFAMREKVFHGWRMAALTTKAYKHHAEAVVRKALQGWKQALVVLREETAYVDPDAEVKERLAAGKEVFNILRVGDDEPDEAAIAELKRAEAAAERIQADIEWSRLEQEAAELAEAAALEAEQARVAALEEGALRRKQQAAAREARREAEARQWRDAFEEEWTVKFEVEEKAARADAEAVVARGKDRAVAKEVKELTKTLVGGQAGLEELTQPFSHFSVKAEGDAHLLFTHSLTGQQVSTAGLRKKEAAVVAKEHVVGRLVAKHMQTLQDAKAHAEAAHVQDRAVRQIASAWRSFKWFNVLLQLSRRYVQQLVDPDTGEPYYFDIRTQRRFTQKPSMFRSTEVQPQPMAWRRNDPDTGGSVYILRRAPWQRNPTPPPGFRLCMACGVELADRRCYGGGCDGFAYCFSCWASHHPQDDALFEHLEHVQHVPVARAQCAHFPEQPACIQTWAPELAYDVFSEDGFYAACSDAGLDAEGVESTDL